MTLNRKRNVSAAPAPRTPSESRVGLRPRRGAGLAEIMLAMIIFALVASSYAAVTLRYATRMKTISAGAARSAALSEYLNRLMALPFDNLTAAAGTFTTTTGTFPNTRTIAVTTVGTVSTVTVILTPTNTLIKPDTVVLTRVKALTTSPLGP